MEILKHFPFNLALRIFGNEEEALEIRVNGLEDALYTIDDRERKVLRLIYQDGLSLEETGSLMGLTRERVRQVEAKALKKLKNPNRVAKIKSYSFIDIEEKDENIMNLSKENKNLKDLISSTVKRLSEEGLEEELDDMSGVPIEDLVLSIRAYRVLKRGNVNYIEDLIKLSEEDLAEFKNMGKKSMEEIKEALSQHGFELSERE